LAGLVTLCFSFYHYDRNNSQTFGVAVVAIVATVISFVYWGAGPSRMGGAVTATTPAAILVRFTVTKSRNGGLSTPETGFIFFIGSAPANGRIKTRISPRPIWTREIYVRLMLAQKANDLGIYVGDDQVVAAANEMLRSLGRNGQAVPLSEFVKQVLQPKHLTAEDFENFVRQYLVMQQLQQAIGLTGELITPQEAAAAYQRDHQELSAQIVFFSASNYLSSGHRHARRRRAILHELPRGIPPARPRAGQLRRI
jgi:hypothetical protein